jgi:tRNA A-37 threonylcarbamoyl transferase component Bud32/tetratricopeptide (TPR) repeat protein
MPSLPESPFPQSGASAVKTSCPGPDVIELLALGRGSTDDVKSHVEKCDSCRALMTEIRTNQEFLDAYRPAMGTGGDAPGSGGVVGSTSIMSVLPGSVEIPGYHNVVELSRGGQGIVYKAVHAVTKRKVAIKMLLRGAYASARELHRFEREIEIVAALRHPNIVTVFDSGVTPDQRPFVVMEYIHGLPLDKFVKDKLAKATKRTRWMYEPHMRLFQRIAAAVQHAHARGVIHRDLKPGNILIDDAGEPHIVDFGMARSLSLSRGPTPTMTHEFGGTLAYASPEQVGGDPERIDVRTDVYSLGVILYELLTGEYPYEVSGSISEIVRNIEHAEPVRPSSLEPSIGYEAETIIMKALAKEPERRYQSAGELARDVEDFLNGRPISARSQSAWYLVRKMARRHKTGVVMGGVVAGLVVVATAAAFVAQGQAGVAQREKARADGVRDGMTRILAVFHGQENLTSPRERFLKLIDASDREVAAFSGGETFWEAEVRQYLADGYWQVDDYAKAEAQYKRILEIREGENAPPKETWGLRIQLARLAMLQFPDGIETAKKYLNSDTLAAIRASGDKVILSEASRVVASILMFTSPKDAIATLEDVRAQLAGVTDDKGELECVEDALATAYFGTGDPKKAYELYSIVYEKSKRRQGDDTMRVASVLDSLADCELMMGKSQEALEHYQRVDKVYRRFVIAPDVRLRHSLIQLAEASRAVGNTADAERYAAEAKDMERALQR